MTAAAETRAAALDWQRLPVRLRPIDALGLPLAAAMAALLANEAWDAAAIVPLAAAAAAGPALARIDTAERRLPNAITLPLLLLAAIACLVRALAGDLGLLAALGCAAVLLLMALAGGMGMGDVKLGAALALTISTLGWAAPLTGLAASVIAGGLASVVALVAGHRSVAFGPWLLVGHALAAIAAALQATGLS